MEIIPIQYRKKGIERKAGYSMAALNPMQIVKFMNMKKGFEARHPRFAAFIQKEILTDVPEGTVVEITVTKPGCAPVTTNMRITAEDLQMVKDT